MSLSCARCGVTFNPAPRRGTKPKYCSDACRKARNAAYYRAEYAPRSAVGYCECEFCGELFVARSTAHTVRACRGSDCQRLLRNARMREYRRRYAEKHGHALERQFAEGRTDARHRRRATLKGAYVETVRITDLAERDGWVCGICAEPVDPDLKWPHLMSKTIDHVVPIALGGAHAPTNCQIAHLTCNSRKRHTIIGEVDHAGSSSESAGSST